LKSKAELVKFINSLSDEDPAISEIMAVLAGFEPPYVKGAQKPKMKQPSEPQLVDGCINPAFLVELRDIALDYNTQHINYYGVRWSGFKEQMTNVESMAKQAGIDMSSYAPEVLSLTDIKSADDIFEASERELKKLADRIEMSHEVGLQLIDDAKKKRWARVLRKACRLQDWCRKPIPKKRLTKKEKETWKYLHPLRYILYTMRSHLMTDDGALEFLDTPPHLIMACLVVKIAQAHAHSHNIDGVLIIIPPRHCKTTFSIGDTALDINLSGHVNNGIVHQNSGHAIRRLLGVREHFMPDTPVGKRRRALFPDVVMDDTVSANKSMFFVKHAGRRINIHQEGNASAWGVHSQAQGLTFHKLLFDDPSDQKEQTEEGTRERTNAAISHTWLPRLTGRTAFFTYICTRWHPEDFVGVLTRLARHGDINIAYYSLACGGPEENFRPIWPEAGYDANFLRATYARLGPAQYSCQYQNNPDSPESRKVKKLVCFDREELKDDARTDPYLRFFQSKDTTYYLSVDPSGSDNKKSHLAGITYAAFGPFRHACPDGSMEYVPLLLFLDYWSGHAGQHEIAAKVKNWFDTRRVDKILTETTGGFHATAEALEVVHNIPTTTIIRRPPGKGTKIDRLLSYAIHLENGDAQFPGRPTSDEHGDTVLQLDPDWQPLAMQLLQAGTTADDNLLDCVRQQLAEVSPDIYRMKGVTERLPERYTLVSKRKKYFDDLTKRRKVPTKRSRAANIKFLAMKSIKGSL
jgi:hypothetical protein